MHELFEGGRGAHELIVWPRLQSIALRRDFALQFNHPSARSPLTADSAQASPIYPLLPLPKPLPIPRRRMPHPPAEHPHERARILVPRALGDRRHAERGGHQQVLGGFDAHAPQVAERRLATFGLESTQQCARADAERVREAIEAVPLRQALPQPVPHGVGECAVRALDHQGIGEGRLGFSLRVQERHARDHLPDLVAPARAQQMHRQVEARTEGARGDDAAVLDEHGLWVHDDRRVTSRELLREQPGGRRVPSVEHAGLGEHEGADADGRDRDATPKRRGDEVGLAAQRAQARGKLGDAPEFEAGDDQQIRSPVRTVQSDANAAGGHHGAARGADHAHVEAQSRVAEHGVRQALGNEQGVTEAEQLGA